MIELLPSAALTVILLLFLAPTPLLMPMSGSLLVVIFIVVYLIYSALFWKETALDERDELHILFSGRISFLVGTAILSLGVIEQGLAHNIDPWLITALVAMVLTKSIARVYSRHRK